MITIDEKSLIKAALSARKNSYSPYSGFTVGAALLSSDGQIFTGCNIESVSYSPTTCAERTALVKAISEGVRDFIAIAVAGGKAGEPPSDFCTPCGVCRQFLYEFHRPGFVVYMAKSENDFIKHSLCELLPLAFGPESIQH